MHGNILYPLNVLKDINPQAYKESMTKYDDRKHVMEQVIPDLNCLWNDAIHLSPVDPYQVKQALRDAGKNVFMEFYQINPSSLEQKNTCIYLYNQEFGNPKEFINFDPKQLNLFEKLPKKTIEYYIDTINNGRNPLMFHLVPHILYKGNIDVSDAKIVKV